MFSIINFKISFPPHPGVPEFTHTTMIIFKSATKDTIAEQKNLVEALYAVNILCKLGNNFLTLKVI